MIHTRNTTQRKEPNAQTIRNRLANHLVHNRPPNRLPNHRTNNHVSRNPKEMEEQLMTEKVMCWTYESQVELARRMGVSITTAKKWLRDIAARENATAILESKPRSN